MLSSSVIFLLLALGATDGAEQPSQISDGLWLGPAGHVIYVEGGRRKRVLDPGVIVLVQVTSARRFTESSVSSVFNSILSVDVEAQLAGQPLLPDSLEVLHLGGLTTVHGRLGTTGPFRSRPEDHAILSGATYVFRLSLRPPSSLPEQPASYPGDRPLIERALPVVRDPQGVLMLADSGIVIEDLAQAYPEADTGTIDDIYSGTQARQHPTGEGVAWPRIGELFAEFAQDRDLYERAMSARARGELPRLPELALPNARESGDH
jgi:hypothetical protein